jgi:sugar phosphate isomerase/epimerase
MGGRKMKLAIAISASDAPDNAFVVFRGIEESIGKAAALGYDGVELAIAGPGDIDISRLDKCLGARGMEIAAISTGLVFAKDGISLLETPDKAKNRFRELIDMAADYGGKINVGRSRGFKGARTFAEAAEALKQILAPLCEYAQKKGVRFLIEPVNRYEIDWIHNMDEGAALLDIMNMDNIFLMPDVFHMNIEDPSVPLKLVEYGKRIGYVHFADSNRRAPGRGHFDFKSAFDALKLGRYEGWGSVEILPLPEPDKAAGEAIDFLRPLVARYNNG